MDVPDGGEALPEDEDLPITRYLVKWKQFSFLHVSWETKRDLESIDQKACQRAIMSLQGRERKGQVPEIGKPPCSKRAFDPQMVEVVCSRRPLSLRASAAAFRRLASRRQRGGGVAVAATRASRALESTRRPSLHTHRRSASSSCPGLLAARPARSDWR